MLASMRRASDRWLWRSCSRGIALGHQWRHRGAWLAAAPRRLCLRGARMSTNSLPELPSSAFAKEDPGDDLDFYAPPRLVTHIDAGAIAALTGFYREHLPEGGRVLDLMSSWV